MKLILVDSRKWNLRESIWILGVDWWVGLRSPRETAQHHSSYLSCEILFYMMALLTLVHAMRHGGRMKWAWLATILHGLTVESVSYFLPDIDNFWHAQSTVMLLGRRLPLHIVCFYPAFLYTASMSVAKMRLKWWAEPFAVGLAVVLLDVPFDIMGIKLLWWTWHDTDPNIFDRHYSVPWTSYYFHATFAAGFTIVFHGSHAVLTKAGKFQSAGVGRELVCCVLTGLLSMPLGVLQFIPVYHVLHDMYHIHTEPCVLLLLTVFAAIVWCADRNHTPFSRTGDDVDELTIITSLHFLFYVVLVAVARPETVVANGLHQTVGPCNITEPVNTPMGQVLYKKKYLCLDNYDEGVLDFHCTPSKPAPYSDWYTMCGTPYPNRVEYVIVVTAFSLLGFLFYWQANRCSGSLPPMQPGRKLKKR